MQCEDKELEKINRKRGCFPYSHLFALSPQSERMDQTIATLKGTSFGKFEQNCIPYLANRKMHKKALRNPVIKLGMKDNMVKVNNKTPSSWSILLLTGHNECQSYQIVYRPHILPSRSVQKQRKKNKSANMIICVTQTTLIGESVTNASTSCVEVIISRVKVIIIIIMPKASVNCPYNRDLLFNS